jgi:RNA polymerase sigma-70 factor (ECF subfamily)
VLGWSSQQTADTLELTLASTTSALQRARVTMRTHLPPGRLDWSGRSGHELTADEQRLVSAYVRATQELDLDGLRTLLHQDLRFSMPPQPGVWVGRDEILASWTEAGFGVGELTDFRCLTTNANGQPAVAGYRRRPGASTYDALSLDVLRVEDGLIAEVTIFGSDLFAAFGLPRELPVGPPRPVDAPPERPTR